MTSCISSELRNIHWKIDKSSVCWVLKLYAKTHFFLGVLNCITSTFIFELREGKEERKCWTAGEWLDDLIMPQYAFNSILLTHYIGFHPSLSRAWRPALTIHSIVAMEPYFFKILISFWRLHGSITEPVELMRFRIAIQATVIIYS